MSLSKAAKATAAQSTARCEALVQALDILTTKIGNFHIDSDRTFHELTLIREDVVLFQKQYIDSNSNLEKLGQANIPVYMGVLDDFRAALLDIDSKLNVHTRQQTAADDNNSVRSNSPQPRRAHHEAILRLPEIPIPKFNGTFSEWLHFRETFTNVVSNHPTTSESNKYYYLRQAVSGQALACIQNIPPGENNFTKAWDLLVERYDNPRLIANSHITGIENPPAITINHPKSLRSFIDHLKGHINALEVLSTGVDIKDLLYMHKILSCLDNTTRAEWEQRSASEAVPTLDSLWQFLERRCKSWEFCQPISTTRQTQSETPLKRHNPNTFTSAHSQPVQRPASANKCPYCKDSHNIFHCTSFNKLTPADRLKSVKQNQLCYNCLHPNKPNHPCSQKVCFKCGKKHHTLLHDSFINSSSFNPQGKNFSNMVRSSRVQTHGSEINNHAQSNNTQMHSNPQRFNSSSNTDARPSQVFSTGSSVSTDSHVLTQAPMPQAITVTDVGSPTTSNCVNSYSAVSNATTRCLLPTAEIHVRNSHGVFIKANCILDSGSDCCLMSSTLAEQLNLPATCNNVCVQGICDSKSIAPVSVTIDFKSRDGTWSSSQKCILVPQITANLPTFNVNLDSLHVPRNLFLADPQFAISKPVDLLLGAAVFFEVLEQQRIVMGENQPIYTNTKLGWIVAGSLPQTPSPANTTYVSNFVMATEPTNVHDQLQQFWKIEEINPTHLNSAEEREVEEHFQNTTVRLPNGHYQVTLPRKPNGELGHSRTQALNRFHSLEARLAKNADLRTHYTEFMEEYESLGHMALASPALQDQSVYYIPHHPVFKPESTTTKLRVVFDASAKATNSTSLNDILHVGPTVQSDLFDIILRFRTRPIAFTADVTKMYRQVFLNPSDQNLQRIFWRSSPDQPVREYNLRTVTYGTAPAAFLATRSLVQLAHDEAHDLPEVFSAITKDFYVDDLLSGADSEEEAALLARQILFTLSSGGFELRKWLSNSQAVMDSIPSHLHATDTSTPLVDSESPTTKTLGLFWNAVSDRLSIASNVAHLLDKTTFTKREFLSCVASIFDPLGLIAPVVIVPKIMFQSLWLLKLDWDEKLPTTLLSQWLEILRQLPHIASISIPRCVLSTTAVEHLQLHGFADASIKAYGACIYLRSCAPGSTPLVRLLCAKSRVAPLKPISISRLELCAAVVLSRLVHKVISALSHRVSQVHLWTDSSNVCAWLKAPPNKKNIFVSLRVSEIQETTNSYFWHHVKSEENPADLISRGISPSALQANSLWWHGPPMLSVEPISSISQSNLCVHTSVANLCVAVAPSCFTSLINKNSSFSRMLRITATCLRFISNIRNKDSRSTTPLTVRDLLSAELLLVSTVQAEVFSLELKALKAGNQLPPKSTLCSLSPILHSDGIIRIGGRLSQSNLPFDTRHQIILPSRHNFTKALILATHLRLLHAGTQVVIADIRRKYWIPSSRRTVRDILRKCINCFKFQPVPITQQMGQLPASRVTPLPPFTNCGTDYAGPIMVRSGGPRSRTQIKAYLVIFICMATKAVHCEIVTDLTTKAFIAAFTRFVARRGIPTSVFSDNATNYQGAKNELAQLSDLLSNTKFQRSIQDASSAFNVQWTFIPPRAPHFGGLWEAAVKSFKRIFRVSTSGRIFSLEELITLTTQVEAILNSRPLLPITEDPDDFNYLSPGHFLLGRPPIVLPNQELPDRPIDHLTRWQRVQAISQQIWSRWSSDYLVSLQKRSKWHHTSPNIKSGALVLLKEDNLPLGSWKLARVVDTFPGPDGKVRVVSVRTQQGLFKRSIQRIFPLPVES